MKGNTNTTSQIMRQFLESVDDGNVYRELSEDCILNMFARCIKGYAEVTGYMRTQITGRFKHVDFENAANCDASQELMLNNRYGRSFEILRRRLKRNKVTAANLSRKAESEVEDDDVNVEKGSIQLATPPRSSEAVQLQYITSIGTLESHHDNDDGGISLDHPCKVKLTLGYRSNEICLVRYEKLDTATDNPVTPGRPRSRSLRPVHTDDEGEDPAPLKVRRALFVDEVTPEADEVTPKLAMLTPRKRHHIKDASITSSSKRTMRF